GNRPGSSEGDQSRLAHPPDSGRGHDFLQATARHARVLSAWSEQLHSEADRFRTIPADVERPRLLLAERESIAAARALDRSPDRRGSVLKLRRRFYGRQIAVTVQTGWRRRQPQRERRAAPRSVAVHQQGS